MEFFFGWQGMLKTHFIDNTKKEEFQLSLRVSPHSARLLPKKETNKIKCRTGLNLPCLDGTCDEWRRSLCTRRVLKKHISIQVYLVYSLFVVYRLKIATPTFNHNALSYLFPEYVAFLRTTSQPFEFLADQGLCSCHVQFNCIILSTLCRFLSLCVFIYLVSSLGPILTPDVNWARYPLINGGVFKVGYGWIK